jgi:hypothetical protein
MSQLTNASQSSQIDESLKNTSSNVTRKYTIMSEYDGGNSSHDEEKGNTKSKKKKKNKSQSKGKEKGRSKASNPSESNAITQHKPKFLEESVKKKERSKKSKHKQDKPDHPKGSSSSSGRDIVNIIKTSEFQDKISSLILNRLRSAR